MADSLDHLRWTRLTLEPQTRPRMGHAARPPLRHDPQAHAGELAEQAQTAFTATGGRRQASGVDPSRLLILRARFVGPDQRDLLERLGLQVVSEREDHQPLAQPRHEVQLCFDTETARMAFPEVADLPGLGIISVEHVRGTGGAIDPLRLT